MNINDLVPDDLIGAVKLHDEWHLYAGSLAEWILDYASYDPAFNPAKSKVVFRNNLLRVDASNADAFCKALQALELFPNDMVQLRAAGELHNYPLVVAVDFDTRTFVNGFTEIPIHQYTLKGWNAFEGDPLKFVPKDIQTLWLP